MTGDELAAVARAGGRVVLDGRQVVTVWWAPLPGTPIRGGATRVKAKVQLASGAWLSVDPGRLTPHEQGVVA